MHAENNGSFTRSHIAHVHSVARATVLAAHSIVGGGLLFSLNV